MKNINTLNLFEELLKKNNNLIHYAIRQTIDVDNLPASTDYQDWYQIGIIAFYRAVETYDSDKGVKFSSYAIPIIKNAIRNEKRDISAQVEIDHKSTSYEEYIYEKDIVKDDVIEIAESFSIVQSLSSEYSGILSKGVTAFLLTESGYSCQEIATMFDTSTNNIRAWISRAKKKMREEPRLISLWNG